MDANVDGIRTNQRLRLGVIVNPIAGMGGKVGLKGTDGADAIIEARRRGAPQIAPERARRALARIGAGFEKLEVVSGYGRLGETLMHELGVKSVPVGRASSRETTAEDTRMAAVAMEDAGVSLLLFAGGDGTARDVFDSVGGRVPILGIPTGVKMYSGVFATTPENAGDVAARFLDNSPPSSLHLGEIMDIDAASIERARPIAHLYGYASIPYERYRIQHAKAVGGADDEAALEALCLKVASAMAPGCIYIFGPGTTTQAVMRCAGVEGTLLGVDALCNGRLVGGDLRESEILELTANRPTRIVVGVIGGQGCLFGRGNQQISARVIRNVGKAGVLVLSSLTKILALDGACLFVDTGDAELDAELRGFIRVETSPDQSILCRVA